MSDKKLTVEELSRIQANYDSHYTYDGLSATHIGQLLNHIAALEQELAQCQRELEASKSIQHAEKLILLQEIETHTATKQERDQLQRQNGELYSALRDLSGVVSFCAPGGDARFNAAQDKAFEALSTNAGKAP